VKPRIRTIKPEAHTDEDLWDLEEETGFPIFRAFTGLWGHSDREGRFEWRPRPLKAGILPYWSGDFSRVLDALATRGFIVKYASGGREFGVIPSFTRHQVINNREEESKLPPPPAPTKEPEQNQEPRREADASPTRDARVPHAPSVERKGTEGNGREPERNGTARADAPPGSGARSGVVRGVSRDTLAEALELPVKERAALALRDPMRREYMRAEQWPEVLEVATALADALGHEEPRLSPYDRDSGVRAVVALFADGRTLEELLTACEASRASDYMQGKDLSAFSPAVVRRLLAPQSTRRGAGKGRQPDYEGQPSFKLEA
jgi:hypothetical protein